ncbi:DUF979 domain-containing protein [Bacillus cereus]|uniref:DUF979 domain-containing protein n=1 Tax=Bacillus cereus TaxID=1396 RepID=UPI00062D5708|nr:DUF979 domain-containing protein [Bacillus cereus]KLA35447.1 hypothetical protein B4080_3360 [Bacillus cereus]MBJ8153884.1 DUF979 domain-containing protein [Bacillus cereus]MCY8952478.1 DUF979 domain-containing protein [Bacillus cereus]PED02697.1 DUF979 domain-containing protein [Bacillus cereus]PED87753.1 DUF979 domain-containing protein [Bacillus cereus]
MIIELEYIYMIAGIFLIIISFLTIKDKRNPKRISTSLFWGIYGVTFLFGKVIPPMHIGILVIIMVLIVGSGGVQSSSHIENNSKLSKKGSTKWGNVLFIPTLLIPVITVIGSIVFKNFTIHGTYLFDRKYITLICLSLASIIALIVAIILTRENVIQSMQEARRLVGAMGWAYMLPQMLATLGTLFLLSGVSKTISNVAFTVIPIESRFFAIVIYVLGMTFFSIIMGNAFLAFPIIMGGIGIPLLIDVHHANVAVLAVVGMLSGYCGTLMTPMAANFNIVPATLFGLSDKNAVIKTQIPTGLLLLVVNLCLGYFLI